MKKTYVQPYWPHLVLGLCTIILVVIFYISGLFRGYRIIGTLVVGIYGVIIGTKMYVLSEKGILVLYMFIPIRRIRWHHISSAMYLHQWEGGKYSKIKGQSIIITLRNIGPVDPEAMPSVRLKHPFGTEFIQFTKRNTDAYVKAFREYYPKLTFQEGSEIFTEDP